MTKPDLQRVYEATAEELRKWQQKCLDMAKRIDALDDPNYAKAAKDAATLGVGFVRFNEDGSTSLLDPSAVFLAPAGVGVETRERKLEDALRNLLGVYDTPLSRRRFPQDDFMKEAIGTARAALKGDEQ